MINVIARKRGCRWQTDLWKLATLPFFLFILIPLLALFLRANLTDVWTHLQTVVVQQAILLSIDTSTLTALVTIIFGTPVAFYLSHRHYRFYRFLDTLVDLPTVLPPAVAGVSLLMAFGRRGLLGEAFSVMGVSIPFTTLAVILAQTFIAAPLYIKSAALGFAAVDCELRKAAALDGANRWQTFTHIIVPMAWISIVSGAVMTWARAMGEFGATIIFAGNFPGRTQTMPLAIYIGFELDLNIALTLSVILILISVLTLALVKGVLSQWSPITPEEIYD
jgi:molybdate transport system permease protein